MALPRTGPVRFGAFAAITMVAAALAVPLTTPTAGAAVDCAAGLTTFVWDGSANDTAGHVGDNKDWRDRYNWDNDCRPGKRLVLPIDDVVTIPVGAHVVGPKDQSAFLQELHNLGTLTIPYNTVLKTLDDSESANLVLHGLLFGTGRFSVTDSLVWNATTRSAATMSTRHCGTPPLPDWLEDCSSPAPAPGVTVIEPGATMAVDGRGVNLFDERIIENHGTVILSGLGYIAADYGTTFKNLRLAGDPMPKFIFRNDLGYYQGFATTPFTLGDFVNTGQVIKASGSGTSVIDAHFTTTDPATTWVGKTIIRSGSLNIVNDGSSSTSEALVKQGTGFGDGGFGLCRPESPPASCDAIALDDPQATAIRLTKADPQLTGVTLEELGSGNSGGLGEPVVVGTINALATPTQPLVIRIYLRADTLNGDTAAHVAAKAPVQRFDATLGQFVKVRSCAVVGQPTIIEPCVDRAMSGTETTALAATGDAVVIVKSVPNAGPQTSRYRVRQAA